MFFLYLLFVATSYFLNRLLYKAVGKDADCMPHGIIIFVMLIPLLNIIVPIILMLVLKSESFVHKKFFRLK